jgi:Cof subfamily protein (haloacid dehalogenase superfamily)
MSIKLFVTDLDGTLLNGDKTISAQNKAAIQAAVAAGVTVTIATGRMYVSALPYAKELGVDVPIITYNGALIKSVAGRVLSDAFLPAADVKEILDYCLARDWYIQLYSNEELYFTVESAYASQYEQSAGVKGHAVGRDGIYQHLEQVPKLLSITAGEAVTEARVAELARAFAGRIMPVRSNPEYVEIVGVGVNKAAAVQELAAKLGLAMDEVMCIGDSNNDLPMLRAAGHSVAMGNARDEVKAACDYVVTDCEHSGVADAIRRYVL